MNVHACFLDEECRVMGVTTWRIHVNTHRLGSLTIALRPGDRLVGWLPVLGYLPWSVSRPWRWFVWWFIVYEPPTRKIGYLARRWPELYGLSR